MLKQADGHTSKSSDRGREHGSRDRRSSSSSKGQGDKEGGLGKRDSTLVTTKGESGREQKNAAAAADSSRVKVARIMHFLCIKLSAGSHVGQCMHAHCLVYRHMWLHQLSEKQTCNK